MAGSVPRTGRVVPVAPCLRVSRRSSPYDVRIGSRRDRADVQDMSAPRGEMPAATRSNEVSGNV